MKAFSNFPPTSAYAPAFTLGLPYNEQKQCKALALVLDVLVQIPE